jgi:hypothetical protein
MRYSLEDQGRKGRREENTQLREALRRRKKKEKRRERSGINNKIHQITWIKLIIITSSNLSQAHVTFINMHLMR